MTRYIRQLLDKKRTVLSHRPGDRNAYGYPVPPRSAELSAPQRPR